MHIVFLLPEYVAWHYSKALRLLLNIISNFLWFTYHFFSIPFLIHTIFKSWVPIANKYGPHLNPGQIFLKIVEEAFERMISAFAKCLLIVCGFTLCVFVAGFGLIVFATWLVLPLVVIALVFQAVTLFIP